MVLPALAAVAGATGAGAAGGAGLGAGLGSVLGGLGSSLFGEGGFTGENVGKMLGAAGIPILGSILGGPPEEVEYKPEFGGIYSYNPYAWAEGEQDTYQQALDQILRNQQRQTAEQQRGFGEQMARRGLGASSIYGTGMGRIAQTGQQALQSQNVARQQELQRQREQRANLQRQQQHAWNVGPGVEAQRLGYQGRAGAKSGMMGQIAQNVGSTFG